MSVMTVTGAAAAAHETFIDAVDVSELFVDSSYQRAPDMTRVRKLAAGWDRRLAGVIEVSDRGPGAPGRYAVVDGQHRWLAVRLRDPGAVMVATVHENLSVAEEAALFDRLNRERRRPSTWDHWRARKAAGDASVAAIDAAVSAVTLRDGRALCIDNVPRACTVRCTATLEKLAAVGGTDLVRDALGLIVDIWGDRQDALDAPIVAGVGLVLHYLENQIDLERLTDTLPGGAANAAENPGGSAGLQWYPADPDGDHHHRALQPEPACAWRSAYPRHCPHSRWRLP